MRERMIEYEEFLGDLQRKSFHEFNLYDKMGGNSKRLGDSDAFLIRDESMSISITQIQLKKLRDEVAFFEERSSKLEIQLKNQVKCREYIFENFKNLFTEINHHFH